ncbi:MAG: TolC family protein [Schleiferiaceae bacterium]
MNKSHFALWLMLLVSPLVAQEVPSSFSLQQAQDYAVEHAYNVRDRQLEIEKTKKLITETASIGLPQISASASFNNYVDIPTQIIPNFINDALPNPDPNAPEFIAAQFGTDYNVQGGVTLNQLIFDGSYIVALVATRVLKEGAALDYETSVIEIRDNVAQAYYSVLVNERVQSILEDNIESLNKSLTETQALYQSGFVEEQDVDQLEILVSNLQNTLIYTQANAKISRILLNLQMGLDVERPIVLTEDVADLVSVTIDGVSILSEEFVLENHIDYRALENQQQGANLSVQNEQMQYLPKVYGFLNYAQTYQGNDVEFWADANSGLWFPTTVWGVNLQWDLFTSWKRVSRVQQAKIDVAKLEVAKEQVTDGLKLQYEQAKTDYEFQLNTFNTQSRNLELAQKILNRTQVKFQQGVASSLDLTQAQNQYLETLTSYTRSALSLLQAKSTMQRVLGNYNL